MYVQTSHFDITKIFLETGFAEYLDWMVTSNRYWGHGSQIFKAKSDKLQRKFDMWNEHNRGYLTVYCLGKLRLLFIRVSHRVLPRHQIVSNIPTIVSAFLERVTDCLCIMFQARHQLWIKTARTSVSVVCISSKTNQLQASTSDQSVVWWLLTVLIESIYKQKPIYSTK